MAHHDQSNILEETTPSNWRLEKKQSCALPNQRAVAIKQSGFIRRRGARREHSNYTLGGRPALPGVEDLKKVSGGIEKQ